MIIGAGFSGTALALALQDRAPANTLIHVVDAAGAFGPGLAYGATHPNNFLNVPAERMSAFPDKPLGSFTG